MQLEVRIRMKLLGGRNHKTRKEKTGVINDPRGQIHIHIINKHYFHLKIVFKLDFEKWGQRTNRRTDILNMCGYYDNFRTVSNRPTRIKKLIKTICKRKRK